jgi:hypothetical protein
MASIPPRGDAPLGSDMALGSVSRAIPKWVRRRPLLLAGWLRLSNRVRRRPQAWLIGPRLWFAGVLAVIAFAWLITRPEAAATLSFIADRWVLAVVGAAIHAASSVSRRKPRLQAEYENSWLSALPYRVSVAARIAFGFGVQIVAIGVLCAGIVVASAAPPPGGGSAAGSLGALSAVTWAAARTVWLGVLGGYVAGWLGGWFAHVFAPKSAAAGTQYAIVRRVRERWAVAPRLQPLSYWPVASARAAANPQVSMRTMLFVLLALPMGTTGAEAIAIGAAWMVGLYVVLNLVATVRTAFAAGWWLRPTPVRLSPFVSTLVSRVLLIQVGLFVVALIAMAAIGRPKLFYTTVGITIVWLPVYVCIGVLACAMALRPKKPSIAGRLSGGSSDGGQPV